MIETRLLRQFIAVAEELNFRRAAERLHMAQPPLSQAILRLEEALGYPVFERTNRKVSLTPAGTAFLATARQLLASLEEGVAAARRVAQGIEGHLRLSFIHITPYAHVLNALRALRAASPAVQFSLREASTQQQVEWLEAGQVDIALLRAPGRSTPGLRFERLSGEDIVIALPSDHRCAGQARVDLLDLAGDDFVASPRRASWARVFMTSWPACACRRASCRAWRSRRAGCKRCWDWWRPASAWPCCRPAWRRPGLPVSSCCRWQAARPRPCASSTCTWRGTRGARAPCASGCWRSCGCPLPNETLRVSFQDK